MQSSWAEIAFYARSHFGHIWVYPCTLVNEPKLVLYNHFIRLRMFGGMSFSKVIEHFGNGGEDNYKVKSLLCAFEKV